ncbi:MAG TPA: sugar phosphate isomerase/epimerase family protein [Bryobacteraceae bacterium]|nr:sugar phosphate isomerase/epimerase family protein [Bryobacteraceae bacterium]
MKISLGSWAFAFGPYADNPVPFDASVKRLAEAGFDGIEVAGFPPHVTLEKYPTRESRQEIVRLLADNGLGVSGYAADLGAAPPAIAGNERKYLELFKRNVEMCVDIGSSAIRVDTISGPFSLTDYDAAFARVAGVWHEAAGIAQDAGIRLVWEFEPGFAYNKPSEVVAMHDTVNHPNFKVMFDTSHAYMCGVVGARQHGEKETLPGGVAEFLAKLQGRIGHIHLIDSDGTLHGDETSTHRPFGEGYVDFTALTPKLLAVPGIEWWCIDLCFWAGSWELVEPSLKFVKNLLAGKAAA